MKTAITITAGLALAGSALAQSSIRPDAKFAWSENIGWTNWRDANAATSGVRVHPRFLSGFIWAENVGWINVGDGSPADCLQYSNATGADTGVNILPNGELTGLAWGENVGWINFDTRSALGLMGMQARFDLALRRFRGWAWGENVGWINLDDETHALRATPTCLGDVDQNGVVNFSDLNQVLSSFNASGDCILGDTNGDGVTNFEDLNNVLSYFNLNCPE
ncbi:MAG: hypothetical protein IBJ10_04065 [Phycisphaerales bacterium]|nr:hypothetical protein [Phycisphaerales bacterium]